MTKQTDKNDPVFTRANRVRSFFGSCKESLTRSLDRPLKIRANCKQLNLSDLAKSSARTKTREALLTEEKKVATPQEYLSKEPKLTTHLFQRKSDTKNVPEASKAALGAVVSFLRRPGELHFKTFKPQESTSGNYFSALKLDKMRALIEKTFIKSYKGFIFTRIEENTARELQNNSAAWEEILRGKEERHFRIPSITSLGR